MSDFRCYVNLFLGGPEGGIARTVQGYAPHDRIGIIWRGAVVANMRDAEDSHEFIPLRYGVNANEFIYKRVKSVTAHGGDTIVTVYEFEQALTNP